jgi:hypothetical protein
VYEEVMPRIPDGVLASVIFLYPTVEDAEQGKPVGGSGFLLAVDAHYNGVPPTVYAVTNSHVIAEGGSSVVRATIRGGETEILDLRGSYWCHRLDGDDVAICMLDMDDAARRFWPIESDLLCAEEDMNKYTIGPGDDVFFAGRFMANDGRQRNLPTARFGNISMMPIEPVLHRRGHMVDSFRVEARSLSGYSGSPVWLYIGPGPNIRSYPFPSLQEKPVTQTGLGFLLALIGIDWGHEPDYKRVLGVDKRPIHEKLFVEQNSGIANVAPAWKIADLLAHPTVVEMREEREKRIHEANGEPAVLDDDTTA